MVFDLELCVEFNDHSAVEVGTIVCNDSLGDTMPKERVMLDEPGHHILGNGGK